MGSEGLPAERGVGATIYDLGMDRSAKATWCAGAGAIVGKLEGLAMAMRGGIGAAATAWGATRAIVALNAVGNVLDPSQSS